MNKFAFVAVLTIIALSILYVGCNSSRRDTSDKECANEEIHQSATDTTDQIIYIGKGYAAIRFGMTHDQLIAVAGEPERRLETACEYLSGGFAVLFNREKKVAAIMCGGFCLKDSPMIERFKGVTPEGIRMGSTLKEVLEAYGKPTEKNTFPEDPSLITVKYSKLGVEFAFRDEKLVHIAMRMLK